MTPKEPTDLDTLAAYAEGYAEFAMKNLGRVPPTMLAVSPEGLLHFIPESLADERAKNDFANIGRLICAAYGATSMVMILESWATMAKPEFAHARLARLNRRDDEHQADTWVDQGFEWFTDLRRVVRTKAAGNRRVGNRADVLFGPRPRRASIRRTPRLAPNADEIRVHPACSTESTSSMALRHSSWMPVASRPERIGGSSFSNLR